MSTITQKSPEDAADEGMDVLEKAVLEGDVRPLSGWLFDAGASVEHHKFYIFAMWATAFMRNMN